MLQLDAAPTHAKFTQEWFGPISFVIATDSTAQSLDLAAHNRRQSTARSRCPCTSTDEAVIEEATKHAIRGGVALSINLTGGVFVNQSAAFSDFHGTGANPAANAALADAAFVANRFRVVQSRVHVEPKAARQRPRQRHTVPSPQRRVKTTAIRPNGKLDSGAAVSKAWYLHNQPARRHDVPATEVQSSSVSTPARMSPH